MVPDIITQTGFTLVDGVILAIMLLAVILGAVRGLFRTLAGIIILIAALVGGAFAARALAPPAAERLYPLLEERVSAAVRQELEEALEAPLSELSGASELLPEALQGKLKALFGVAGLHLAASQQFEDAEAAARAALESAIFALLRLVFTLLIFVLLHLAAKAVDLMMKLPVLHQFNALGGALLGVAEGLLLVLLFVWLAGFLGLDTQNAFIVRFFHH